MICIYVCVSGCCCLCVLFFGGGRLGGCVFGGADRMIYPYHPADPIKHNLTPTPPHRIRNQIDLLAELGGLGWTAEHEAAHQEQDQQQQEQQQQQVCLRMIYDHVSFLKR